MPVSLAPLFLQDRKYLSRSKRTTRPSQERRMKVSRASERNFRISRFLRTCATLYAYSHDDLNESAHVQDQVIVAELVPICCANSLNVLAPLKM